MLLRKEGDKLVAYEGRIPAPERRGHVYLFWAVGTNYIKIGQTRYIMPRLATVRTYSPYKVMPLGAYRLVRPKAWEQYFHKRYGKHRLNGEWFELDDDAILKLRHELFSLARPCDCSSICRKQYRGQDYESLQLLRSKCMYVPDYEGRRECLYASNFHLSEKMHALIVWNKENKGRQVIQWHRS